MLRWNPRIALAVTFFTGFVFLLLEITAGRLLAPAVGFSLETWTGIIGVVLAGQAIGDAVGGRLADRYPAPRLLALVLAMGGAAVLIAPTVSVAARGLLPSAPLMVRVIATSAIVLVLPSLLLAGVTPIVSRLTLRTVEGAGRTIGLLSATSTVGSVLGVIIGGFVLLEKFGVRAIVHASGALLLTLAVFVAATQITPAPRTVPDDAAPSRPALTSAPWLLYLLPAVAGCAIMAVELAGARLAAMMFGTSLYTWVSTIGTVMLGISAGTAIGGWLADRNPSRALASWVLIIGAGATASLLLVMYAYATVWPGAVQRLLSTVPPSISLPLVFGGLLLPASLAYGAVTPIAIRIAVQRVSDAGAVVGKAYAAHAVGSIAGTFVTGFVLISHVGARAVIVLVAAGAVMVATWVATPLRRSVQLVTRGAAFMVVVAACALAIRDKVPSPCLRESNYYCIRVQNMDATTKSLVLDNLVHTYIHVNDPARLEYDYEQVFAMTAAELAAVRGHSPRVLLIGGGGYTFPRYITHVYANDTMDVVEIDPEVTATAYSELGLARSAPVRTWNEDGRQFLLRETRRKYDFIMADAFRDAYSVPYHLTTREFAQMASDALEAGGIFAANVIDGQSALFLRSYIKTLQQVFPHVYLLPLGAGWRENPQITSVVLASSQPIDVGRLVLRRPTGVPDSASVLAYSENELTGFLDAGAGAMVLTDDRSPVENFLARVYAESVKRRGPSNAR